MTTRVNILALTLAAFAVISALALKEVGYFGVLAPHFRSWGGAQVFADLVILAVMTCQWMRQDARARGLAAWPFLLITLISGSFGPLLYLLVRELWATSAGSGARALST